VAHLSFSERATMLSDLSEHLQLGIARVTRLQA
jgi:hypothetical protein